MISDKLYDYLLHLPRRNLVNLMLHALDEMQAYNGRSFTFCIMEGMGAEKKDEGVWIYPSLKEAKENLDNPPLI